MLMSTAEKKKLRAAAKKGPKEPSIEQLAKTKARGNGAANGQPHPSVTSTTTPVGILANDRDADGTTTEDRWGKRSNVGSSPPAALSDAELRQRLMDLSRLSPGESKFRITSAVYLRLADLQAVLVWKAEEREEAEDLVDRFGHLLKPAAPIVSPETKPPARETKGPERETKGGPRETAEAWHSVATGQAVELGLDLLHEHPENRDSKDCDPDVKDLAESILEDKQLQPIMVRVAPPHWKLPEGHFQLVFGERRWRACRVAGLQSVRGVIRTDLDDATTRRLIVIENAKRKDLNPIQKARLLEALCSPNKDGTDGLTREAAAKHVGLESGSAASNLVRLLKLPKVWQERVASGELDESWARLIVPYIDLPPVLEQLERDWKDRDKAVFPEDCAFTSRRNLEDQLPAIVDQECRRIDQERYAGRGFIKPQIDAADPAVRKQLGIVEVLLPDRDGKKTKQVAVATKVKAFDELVKSQAESRAKAGAEKVGRDKPAPKREPTAAERKQAAADRTRQLTARIAAWRDGLLRRELIALINAGIDNGFRLAIAYAAGESNGLSFHQVLEGATKAKSQSDGWRRYYWSAVADAKDADAEEALTSALALQVLQHEPSDWRHPTVPHALIERYAEDLGVNVAQAWGRLQETQGGKLAGGQQLEELFLFHRTDELLALCRELGVGVMPTATRAAMVKQLLGAPVNNTRRLPLPKCIKQVAVVAKGKPAKGKAVKHGKR